MPDKKYKNWREEIILVLQNAGFVHETEPQSRTLSKVGFTVKWQTGNMRPSGNYKEFETEATFAISLLYEDTAFTEDEVEDLAEDVLCTILDYSNFSGTLVSASAGNDETTGRLTIAVELSGFISL